VERWPQKILTGVLTEGDPFKFDNYSQLSWRSCGVGRGSLYEGQRGPREPIFSSTMECMRHCPAIADFGICRQLFLYKVFHGQGFTFFAWNSPGSFA